MKEGRFLTLKMMLLKRSVPMRVIPTSGAPIMYGRGEKDSTPTCVILRIFTVG